MNRLQKKLLAERIYRCLLLIMALFLVFEFVIHFFGLPLLEHDKIFLPTHDRYIALYGLTLGGLLIMLATTHRHDKLLYRFTFAALFLGGLNAVWISINDYYQKQFAATDIDSQLGLLGLGVLLWYSCLKIADHYSRDSRASSSEG